MKLRNTSAKPIQIGFSRGSDGEKAIELVINPQQLGEVPDSQWAVLRVKKPYSSHLEKGRLVEEQGEGAVLPGDGEPNCLRCYGRGFISTSDQAGCRCACTLKRDIIANVNRIYPGINLFEKAPHLPKDHRPSRLLSRIEHDTWITSDDLTLKAHLRWIGLRQIPKWFCRVRTDSNMMEAWLATAKAKGAEILDVDVAATETLEIGVEDLALPPDLLVMKLGVKRARNVAANEVLMEILQLRGNVDKPTWIVDQPDYPLEHEAHRCNSPEVISYLEDWKHLALPSLRKGGPRPVMLARDAVLDGVEDVTPTVTSGAAGPRFSMSGGKGSTRNENLKVSKENKR